jgi:hypothetical protein
MHVSSIVIDLHQQRIARLSLVFQLTCSVILIHTSIGRPRDWLGGQGGVRDLPVGLLRGIPGSCSPETSVQLGDRAGVVVSRGGPRDLACIALDRVRVPPLLIVGGFVFGVMELNEPAFARLKGPKVPEVVPARLRRPIAIAAR